MSSKSTDPSPWLPVSLACNDDHGNLDVVCAITIPDDTIDPLMRLEGDPLDGDEILFHRNTVKIAGIVVRYRCHAKYVGNLIWDQVEMPAADVALLVRHLRGLAHWTCTQAVVRLYEKWYLRGQFVEGDFTGDAE